MLCKKAHPYFVDAAAIRKFLSVEGDRLEAEVRSASTGMDAVLHHEVLRGPSVGVIRTVVRYCMGFSTALIPHLPIIMESSREDYQ
jgi:hypothetical protein